MCWSKLLCHINNTRKNQQDQYNKRSPNDYNNNDKGERLNTEVESYA